MKTYLTAVGFGGGVFSQPRCNEIFDGKIERVKNDVLYPHGNHRALWPTGNPQFPFSQNSYSHCTSCEEHLCVPGRMLHAQDTVVTKTDGFPASGQ